MRDMLVDFAPYVFRGKLAGFLTRLSATGLANVTSGGGQVPAFVVSQNRSPKSEAQSDSLNPATHDPRTMQMIRCLFGAARRRPRARRAQRGRSLSRHPARRARGADRRRGERRGGGEHRRGARRSRRAVGRRADRAGGGAAADRRAARRCSTRSSAPTPASSASSRSRASSRARMAIVVAGRAPRHPLRAHGRRDAADHAAGDARRLPAGRRAQPAPVRADAARARACASRRRAAPRFTATFDPDARVGEDQRADQPPLLVEPAGGRGVHHAGAASTASSSATAPPATTSARSTATCAPRR